MFLCKYNIKTTKKAKIVAKKKKNVENSRE
jgi:hypothetical protein